MIKILLNDYSEYESCRSCNGGCYGYSIVFYQMDNGNNWGRYDTSTSELIQDEDYEEDYTPEEVLQFVHEWENKYSEDYIRTGEGFVNIEIKLGSETLLLKHVL